MKFSLTAASIFAFACLSAVKADSYSDAIKEFCDGIEVTAPIDTDVFVAGQNATVTVTRIPNSHEKTITGLDLYSVDTAGNPKYVQNTWTGQYSLNTQASISDDIPTSVNAGYYYYRVWVTNMINGQHGPDCVKTSRTFKVTTGSHTNDAGVTSYAESLDDHTYFKPEFAKGCFGLSVKTPAEGSTQKQGEHVSVQLSRDGASQTDSLTKVEIYKYVDGVNDESVYTVWSGQEGLTNAFIVKDHLKIPNLDTSASYYYKLDVTSQVKGETCSFQSGAFKVTA
ncbi:hypothetical protein HMPREF1544_06495 [Mucor circinelloides 1006PhL]|uniref:Uncharacterized protein n=1 Tax=Mucor circinelloides f. circinelloides (strain 1006PhL) TaxID=1220926 RepID=S2JAJ5_MUCC1|nr:hypothetical protein HMPREF1544_06495 [Mucor circinelloides 1006PhL]KAG1094798.1 hypothetical protein G6F42_018685 [Rhizopus arrhizus]